MRLWLLVGNRADSTTSIISPSMGAPGRRRGCSSGLCGCHDQGERIYQP